jgi:hypothetical protein
MARKSSRKSGRGVLSRLWAIPGGILSATGNSAGIVGRSVGNIARRAVKTVKNVGNTYSKKANNAISKAITRRRRNNTRRNNMRR